MLKTLLLGLVSAAITLPGLINTAWANDDYEDRARVTSVTPQSERVNNPRQECRTEYVRESYYENNNNRSYGGAIIGGVTGGLLGNTIGRGKGRIAAAAVGAGIGALVGDRVDNNQRNYGNQRVESRPVERCVQVDNWQTVNSGYLVNYQYNGRNYSTVTDRDPGDFIPVHVEIRPSGYVSDVSYHPSRNNDRWNNDRWNNGRGHGYGHNKHQDRRYW
jgi:uncharacterized protein YcfJ